jgi:hypothetical protein
MIRGVDIPPDPGSFSNEPERPGGKNGLAQSRASATTDFVDVVQRNQFVESV